MLDLVVVAMAITLPVLACSIWLVRRKRLYSVHKFIQLAVSSVLVVAIALFELEMRLVGWQQYATESPWSRTGRWNDPVDYLLIDSPEPCRAHIFHVECRGRAGSACLRPSARPLGAQP